MPRSLKVTFSQHSYLHFCVLSWVVFIAHGPIEYELFLNRSIWSIDGTLTSGQSGSGNYGNEGIHRVIYWPLTEPLIKRCTCVNKRKKKRKHVDVMKEYRQVPVAFELVGDRKAAMEASLQTEGCCPRLSNPNQDAEEVLSGFWKITQRSMVKRRSWVNVAVRPCLHSSLTHHRNIENKVWEIHIFIKKCARYVHWSS